ncbi:VWA-like domain-containing protein [Dyella sp. ASV21]|uniref:vWA domain-containing protein n=1 Tax=Dyella sp. ASV21 TaxID=2795114 RepID=UPI0018EDCA70|nr:VWA-like domain-containing protein [Dyella sp. ASV21]
MDKQKALDKAVLGLFQGHASTFLSTIYCSLKFVWDESIPTACTNGLELRVNPTWFVSLSEKMRVTLLAHELWHIAYMHMARVGDRNFQIWNMAGDYAINIMLEENGYHFDLVPGTSKKMGLIDPQYRDMSAEQIYDKLVADSTKVELPFGNDFSPLGGSGSGDSDDAPKPLTVEEQAQIMAAVVRATTMSQMSDREAGQLPGTFTEMLDELLNPKLPWQSLMTRWLTERSESGFNWRIPNRRYQDIYLPSPGGEEGLAHLLWALDVSGSVTQNQLRIFNSELKGAKEAYNPERMTVVTFDTEIQNTWEFSNEDDISGLCITGRGGTDMTEVFELARKLQVTAMVMFSDMWCNIPPQIPGVAVLWLCYDNPKWTPPYGDVIYVDSTPSIPA